MQLLPNHLKKYIVSQDYEKYTPVDQACWRYVLRQLRDFLSVNAHECYLDGLQKTGIEISRIPKISDISEKLEAFGWRAFPVSGFIPPAAFMELQSLSVLPIASDMRTIDHLGYTPAPDIVHEAAGHAPILVNTEFADYLKSYAQVAKKAIISKEDLNLYEAIRQLSDIKENPNSKPQEIAAAQKYLEQVSSSMSHVSEASELSRMNWWTAEYGLIGDLQAPKIFGAGLLSSVGESRWCLSEKVKKIRLSVDCIKTTYDITEPQPQLFVAEDFKHLKRVLEQMADQMAFRVGGIKSAAKAIKAESVNTIQLESGLQISGQLVRADDDNNGQASFIRFQGPTQLCIRDREISGHGRNYHNHGYSSPLGPAKNMDLGTEKFVVGSNYLIEFNSGIILKGSFVGAIKDNDRNLIASFKDCSVSKGTEILFDPSWGIFDLAIGSQIISVFGGPADRAAFGETEDFIAARVPKPNYSQDQLAIFSSYQKVRDLRENTSLSPALLEEELSLLIKNCSSKMAAQWLFWLEIYELSLQKKVSLNFLDNVSSKLKVLKTDLKLANLIEDGLKIADQLD